MPAMQPTADQFRAFRDDPHDGPIAQVNLLKFRVKAACGADEPEHGVDEPGAVAYQRYVDAFRAAAEEVGGYCLLYGEGERYFIGQGDWDAVLVTTDHDGVDYADLATRADLVVDTRNVYDGTARAASDKIFAA